MRQVETVLCSEFSLSILLPSLFPFGSESTNLGQLGNEWGFWQPSPLSLLMREEEEVEKGLL